MPKKQRIRMKKPASAFILALLCAIVSCQKEPAFRPEWTREKAPSVFRARFETTKGDFEMEVVRDRSPHAADRLYQLIRHRYYDGAMFYRVVPDYIAQFGILDTPARRQWQAVQVPDEPVRYSNRKGTVSFARLGKASRGSELFINIIDNPELDTLNANGVKGYPALGRITEGMETVRQLYGGYGETTMGDPDLYAQPALFYQKFPKLDIILKAYLAD
jgi:peptidyl-prolyl cis-trans isomerase A (cyclophilin A)